MKTFNLKQKSTLVLLLWAVLSLSMRAQVTVGSDVQPNSGALLDLKEFNDATAKSGGRTASRGLMLPRVKLTAFDKMSDLGVAADKHQEHIGVTVYNVNQCLDYGMSDSKGVYTWDGLKWSKLGSASQTPEVSVFKDPRDGEEYLYRKFGNAGTWMLENMRATSYDQGGTPPVLATTLNNNADIYEKKYIYPAPDVLVSGGADPSYFNQLKAMGLLYNWAATTNNENRPEVDGNPIDQRQLTIGSTPGPNEVESVMSQGYVQGICPNGWHVPSDREWNVLEKELTENAVKYSTSRNGTWNPNWDTDTNKQRGDILGEVLKTPCSPPGITTTNIVGKSFPASQGGFNMYLTGYFHHLEQKIKEYGVRNLYRSSSSGSATNAYHRSLAAGDFATIRTDGLRSNMAPVRCKKNN